MTEPTFGCVFGRDLDEAGRIAAGGRSDGIVQGIDYDREVRHDLRGRPAAKTRHVYPTTRYGRSVRSIRRMLSGVKAKATEDTSGW